MRNLFYLLCFAFLMGQGSLVKAATSWQADLVKDGDKVKLTNPRGALSLTEDSHVSQGFPVKFEVACKDGLDCSKLTLLKGDAPALASGDSTKRSFTMADDFLAGGGQLSVKLDGKDVVTIKVADPGPGSAPPAREDTTTADLPSLLKTNCPPSIEPSYTPDDSQSTGHGTIVVNPFGQVLGALPENLDENDSLTVVVMADSRLAPLLRIRRKSALRTPGVLRTVGEDVKITIPPQQAGEPCRQVKGEFRDLAPGTAEFEILVQTGSDQTQVGSFDMVVDALYSGLLSFGPIRSDVVDHKFTLAPAPSGTGKIIVASENGDRETLYTVFYTPFIWGKRDIEKPISRNLWYHHVNPALGITVNNFSDNALAGITIDWGIIVLSAGVHFSRVSVLSPKSGLAEGSPFTGAENEIPTQKRWKQGKFLGVSLDLRAAAQLLGAVTRGAAGGNP